MGSTQGDSTNNASLILARRISRRALLKGLAGFGALGFLAPACTSAPLSPTPATTAAPKAASTAAAANPAGKSIVLATPRAAKINWTQPSGTQSGIFMAHETGAWKEMGINSELVNIASSSRAVAAFESGEIDASVYDWLVAFTSLMAGGRGRIVSAMASKQVYSVIANKGITKPEEVKGKKWGITRIGSGIHSASLLALDLWGLKPADVIFIELQEVPAILAAMQAGQIEVGMMSPPTTYQAARFGLNVLIDLGKDGPEYPSVGIGTTQTLIDNSPDFVRAIVAGYSLGVRRFREDPELAISVLKKYLQTDDRAILEQVQKDFSNYLTYPPVVPIKSAERVLADFVKTEPKAASLKVEQVATNRFIEELDQAGFFK